MVFGQVRALAARLVKVRARMFWFGSGRGMRACARIASSSVLPQPGDATTRRFALTLAAAARWWGIHAV